MTAIQQSGIIYMNRGDNFSHPIHMNIGTLIEPIFYRLQPGDKLYFGIMQPHEKFEDAIVRKVYDYDSPKDEEGHTLLELVPDDTLKLASGKYYYQVKLLTADNKVYTVVVPTLFYIND